MNKKLAFFASIIFLLGIAAINGCKKEEDATPVTEPITIVRPDSSAVRLFPGDSLPIEANFLIDRPINWILCRYDYDTAGIAGHVYTYPDTLFLTRLDTINPRTNQFTVSNIYRLPVDSIVGPYDIVRFRMEVNAGKATFTPGQNYPQGIVSYQKEFRIDVR
jgi:hypothetical protein